MECKLLHCEYKASRDVDYQSMPLQCIVFSGLICSQHAIEMDLLSQKAPKNPDSNDSSPISVSLKTKKLFKFVLLWHASCNLTLNAALVPSTNDLEVPYNDY